MKTYPNIVSIAGEGQNVGKTMFAQGIISKFSRQANIIGLKISPHTHKSIDKARFIKEGNGYTIFEETAIDTNKDTSRMLAAGAIKSYLVMADDESLMDALTGLFEIIGENALIVCESGRLSTIIKPGISFMIRGLNCRVVNVEKKNKNLQYDRVVTYTTNGFDMVLGTIQIVENSWRLEMGDDLKETKREYPLKI